MNKVFCMVILIFLFLTCGIDAQTKSSDLVTVNTWDRGNGKLVPTKFTITLTPQNSKFQKLIATKKAGLAYLLSVMPNRAVDLKGEHWVVLLEKSSGVIKDPDGCANLLLRERPCETGGDNFPREDHGIFYPYQEKKVLVNGEPWIEWKPLYSMNTTRKFLVSGFEVTFKAINIVFKPEDKTKIESLTIDVEFKNR